MLRKTLILSLLLAASPAAAEVYGCEVDGKVAYQAEPCEGDAGDAIELSDYKLHNDTDDASESSYVQTLRELEVALIRAWRGY